MGVNILEDARHWIGLLLYNNLSTVNRSGLLGIVIVQICKLLLIYIKAGLLTLSQLSNAEVDILRSTKSQT